MRAQLLAAVKVLLALTLLVGVGYPLVVTGIAQVAFNHEADGSLITKNGKVVGSELLGQAFAGEQWFQPRPSAADYDAQASGGTNLGPTNPDLIDAVAQRVADYRAANGLTGDEAVPVDAVTSSGSGLDPHISKANARYQARRVAEARGMSVKKVEQLIADNTDEPSLGFLGEPGVNVLTLNLALQRH
ncbi:MAG: potassium-transporting ATPase subunit KdpC [Acidimicrobiia bacterium]|jgi:K+-transporting ATPase ATPase C chain